MHRQQTEQGHFLQASPAFLVVPTAIETRAEQFVSPSVIASEPGAINPFAGRLRVISEPRLDTASATAWYLWADPNMIDTVEYAYLQGEEGPQIQRRENFNTDGLDLKVRHSFAARASTGVACSATTAREPATAYRGYLGRGGVPALPAGFRVPEKSPGVRPGYGRWWARHAGQRRLHTLAGVFYRPI